MHRVAERRKKDEAVRLNIILIECYLMIIIFKQANLFHVNNKSNNGHSATTRRGRATTIDKSPHRLSFVSYW
jgi:hypothetical protein